MRRWGAGFAAVFVLVYFLAVVWERGQIVDAWLFGSAQVLDVGLVGELWPVLARRVLPVAMVVVVALMTFQLDSAGDPRSRRWLVAVVAVVVVPVIGGRILRDLVLVRPEYAVAHAYAHNSFPSTHVSIVVALAVAIWLLAPTRSAGLAVCLVGVVVLAAVGNVVGHAHRPSDVVGSILLVLAVWGLSGVRAEPRSMKRPIGS